MALRFITCSNHKWPAAGLFFLGQGLTCQLRAASEAQFGFLLGYEAALTWARLWPKVLCLGLTRPMSREPFTLFVWLFGGHRVNALAARLEHRIPTRTNAPNPPKAQELFTLPRCRNLICKLLPIEFYSQRFSPSVLLCRCRRPDAPTPRRLQVSGH
jgi:hypothetical protein